MTETPDTIDAVARRVLLEHLPSHQADRFWPRSAKELGAEVLRLRAWLAYIARPWWSDGSEPGHVTYENVIEYAATALRGVPAPEEPIRRTTP